MNRRNFSKALGSALGAASLVQDVAAQRPAPRGDARQTPMLDLSGPPLEIGMLIHPDFVMQDLIGPHLFLSGLMNVNVHLVWKTRDLVLSDRGIAIQPTITLADCPKDLTILFVPGGLKGTLAMMNDPEVIAFLQDRGKRSRYVTSVCTGSLLLGAAGLLRGYKATSHWTVRDLLPLLGAETVPERYVVDRNRITGGGVTAGLDFGLILSSKLRNQSFAETQQLVYEYDP